MPLELPSLPVTPASVDCSNVQAPNESAPTLVPDRSNSQKIEERPAHYWIYPPKFDSYSFDIPAPTPRNDLAWQGRPSHVSNTQPSFVVTPEHSQPSLPANRKRKAVTHLMPPGLRFARDIGYSRAYSQRHVPTTPSYAIQPQLLVDSKPRKSTLSQVPSNRSLKAPQASRKETTASAAMRKEAGNPLRERNIGLPPVP